MSDGRISTYRDLIAWQQAMSLVLSAYRATESMPDSERFGLRSQIRRSAVSVPSSIAEGYGRESTQDYVRFLCVARGSLYELRTQFEISVSLGYLIDDEELAAMLAETDRVLHGSIRGVERSARP